MSKRHSKFNQRSSFSNREENQRPKQWRSGASNGSHSMADGEATCNSETDKLRMITQVEVMHKKGLIADRVKCPICQESMKTENFGRHMRRVK